MTPRQEMGLGGILFVIGLAILMVVAIRLGVVFGAGARI